MDVDVLVVGAGPVGLFLASELMRRGHSCAIIERNAGPSTHSKALALMPRTLQLFERAGLHAAFLEEVNKIRGVRFVTPRGAAYVAFAGLRTPYPFVAILPQWKTEALLAERLHESGGAVSYGSAFQSMTSAAPGGRCVVQTEGAAYEITARYVAGCDGVHSMVRDSAGIAFPGHTYEQRALLADVCVSTPVPSDEARVHIDRTGMVTLFPMSAVERRIVVVAPRERLPESPSRGWLQARIDRAGFRETLVEDVAWGSAFGVHRKVAQRMRAGNVFLAGDAAHAHSPVGGQGMNTGLEDAWTLAECLSSVLRGDAPEATLDRYETQRLPAARSVVRQTDLMLRALAHPNRVMQIGREYLAPYIIRIPLLRDRVVRELLTA